jgi:photosystem II stability/assembly factor-like uncharacterized protein
MRGLQHMACLLLAWLPLVALAQQYELKPLSTDTKTSIRGLAVVNQEVIWVSGSNGYVGKSVDAGKTWKWTQPSGYEKLDFRSIQAFSADKAIVVNAGSPAYVLLTDDGGKTWSERYKNVDTAIFLDGMDFWDDRRGMIFGDPIENKMQLLLTENGGETWKNVNDRLKTDLKKGEAGFAASGTTIRTHASGKTWIATGGTHANVYYSSNFGKRWRVFPCPILQGQNSTGVFSMDFFDDQHGVVVGGDYLKDKESSNNMLYTTNGGKTWLKPSQSVAGYRSGVTYVTKDFLVATGTSGTDVSRDGGKHWVNISKLSFNAVKSADGLIILAGGKGQVYELKLKN